MRLTTLLLSLSISGFTADVIWNDSVNGSSWNFANHWSPVGIPGTADTAIFNTIGNSVSDQFMISIIAPVSVGSLQFNNGNPETHYWIFSPTSLQLNANTGNSSILVTASNRAETVLDTPIILGKDLDLVNHSPYRLIFEKAIMGNHRNVSVSGPVEFAGGNPNTYSGTTTIRNGTLFLNKVSGESAVSGNLTLDSGSIEYLSDRQISSEEVTLLGHSTINLGSHLETLKSVRFEKSFSPKQILIGANGGLSITKTLSLSDLSSIVGEGTLFLAGDSAEITFAGTSQNGHIDSPLHLDNRMLPISVNSTRHLSLNGPITNGGIIKQGYGILDIASTANLSGLSIQEGGIHLNGNLTSATPIQIYPEAFLYGTGSIQGNLVIQGTMSVGEVIPDNHTSHVIDYFSFDRIDTDGTHPSQLLFLTGDFSTGHVSDGIHVDGDITFSPESTLVIKFNPNMLSSIDSNGKIILDSPKILLAPAEGVYRLGETYRILYAGSIQGEVGSISSRFAMINPLISYITEDGYSGVSFSLSLNRFSDLFSESNTAPVAAFLDALAAEPTDNSSIIVEALINTAELEDICDALAQLQPSAFTSLSVMQQNDLFYIRNAIYSRLYQEQQNCLFINEEQNGVQIWGGAFGGSAHQTNQDGEPGYNARSPGAILALDALISENTIFGAGLGYIYTFHDWKRHRGNANIQNVYGSVYSQYANPNGFFTANLTAGYSFFDVNRKINIGPGSVLRATANSHFGGFDGSIDLRMGAHFPVKATIFTPFLGLDYMIVQQNSTHEKGARVLNLEVKSHVGDLLTTEGGFEWNFCHWKEQTLLKALLRFSVIGESRFFGRYEKATFSTGDSFKVKGYYPSRVLGAFGTGLSATFGSSTLFLTYQAKTNWQFTDQFLTLEYLWRF